ncbi:MAG: hypothetical protein HQ568_09105 [Calditrichaeota bacterium]|nr:hypothetical protein [Calditrichota bacterium]
MINLPLTMFLSLFLLTSLASAQDPTQDKDPTCRFGYALFNPHYTITPLDAGSFYRLQSHTLATSKIEHAGDLFFFDPTIFHPDLVTAGRPVYLSSLYNKPRGTRIFWNSRPFRDTRTGRSDLSLIPVAYIGSLRSEQWGALDGAVSTGATVDIQSLDIQTDEPTTFLTHQDGYYDFGPVEFLHTRQIKTETQLTTGGLIPSSWGRFQHADYKGHILYAQVSKTVVDSNRLSIACLTSLNKTKIPFIEMKRRRKRSDFDIDYTHYFKNSIKVSLKAYHNESVTELDSLEGVTELDSLDDYGRESGLSVRVFKGGFGGYFRASRLHGCLPLGTEYDLTEIEGSIGWSKALGLFRLRGLIGGYGWAPSRVRPVFSAGIEADINPLGVAFVQVKQAVDPHSPEMMYARYRTARPQDDFQPIWLIRLELPVLGAEKPVTIQQSGRIGVRRKVPYGEFELSGFTSNDLNPVIWSVKHDSVITLINLARRSSFGWLASYQYRNDPFRASLALVRIDFNEVSNDSNIVIPINYREPGFRLTWETGWHRSFWEDYFEADISLSGKYFGSFFAYESDSTGWQEIGGAYPLDIRFTFRIQRFNFYYGLHNWNSYQYFLVPGYKMIHKEEYWGINWILLN